MAQYVNQKQIEIIECKRNSGENDYAMLRALINQVMVPAAKELKSAGCLVSDMVENLNEMILSEAKR